MSLIRLRASSTDRYIACPGAWRASQGLSRPAQKQAGDGENLHRLIVQCFEQGLRAEDVGLLGRDASIVNEFTRKTRELTLEMNATMCGHEETLEPVDYPWKGHNDFLAMAPGRALVIDYKTGRLPQPAAWSHAQLRNYAVMIWLENKESVREMDLWLFSAGNMPSSRFTHVHLSIEELQDSEQQLRALAEAVFAEDAARCPGEAQCKYCDAAGNPDHCPENCDAITALTIPDKLTELAPQEISDLMIAWKALQERGKYLEAFVRARLEAGVELPNWKLQDGKRKRSLKDVPQAFSALQHNLGVDEQSAAAAFLGCAKVSISALETAVYTHMKARDKKMTRRLVKDIVAENLGDLVADDRDCPTVRRVFEEDEK